MQFQRFCRKENIEITEIPTNWCDTHSHCLPGIDDGCRDVEESINLLSYARETGVVKVAATPHYYPNETIEQFLLRREAAFQKLQQASEEQKAVLPELVLGAEVAYYDGIQNAEDLPKLCIENTKYLLLELPFKPWDPMLFRNISAISNNYGITLIAAHLERYQGIQIKDTFKKMLDTGIKVQMNASCLLKKETIKTAKKEIKNGRVFILGSDMHNMQTRIPNLMQAVQVLYDEQMKEEAKRLQRHAETLFG